MPNDAYKTNKVEDDIYTDVWKVYKNAKLYRGIPEPSHRIYS